LAFLYTPILEITEIQSFKKAFNIFQFFHIQFYQGILNVGSK